MLFFFKGGIPLKGRSGLYFGQDKIGRKHWLRSQKKTPEQHPIRNKEISKHHAKFLKDIGEFRNATFDDFVKSATRKLGDKYLLGGGVSGYNVMEYEVSHQHDFGEALFADRPTIFHSMYNQNIPHGMEILKQMTNHLGYTPEHETMKKASSVLWATGGKNGHIKKTSIRKQDWGYDQAVQFYDEHNNVLPVKSESDYEKYKDKICFGRSCEYAIAFHPKNDEEGEKIASFLNHRAQQMPGGTSEKEKGDYSPIAGSWFGADFRSTTKVDSFKEVVANKKLIGGQELIMLSKEHHFKGFDTKHIFVGKGLQGNLFKSRDISLMLTVR